jgi:hypothetical protein
MKSFFYSWHNVEISKKKQAVFQAKVADLQKGLGKLGVSLFFLFFRIFIVFLV